MIEATLSSGDEALMKARAWRIRTSEIELPDDVVTTPPAPPGPEQGDQPEFFETAQ